MNKGEEPTHINIVALFCIACEGKQMTKANVMYENRLHRTQSVEFKCSHCGWIVQVCIRG